MSLSVPEVYTTIKSQWNAGNATLTEVASDHFATISIDTTKTLQTIDGFGACFNEVHWKVLQDLPEHEKEKILDVFFKPGEGLNFSLCRMPIGANDFALKFYSYDETKDDFELKDFSIENDKSTLIPFIKSALKRNPNIKIWASPWCPPQWMKQSGHYACRRSNEFSDDPRYWNDLPKDKEATEGVDAFILDDKHLEAYARYFGKFIDAYKAEGINIFMVMPQNEWNSCQVFPSCVWSPEGLVKFIRKLDPEMKKRGVEIFLGTMERPDPSQVFKVLEDEVCKDVVKGVGFQWAGKAAIVDVHKRYPNLKYYQSELECHNADNDWVDGFYTWHLMTHYFNNGASAFDYWNFALQSEGLSTWGWDQNSLVTVDLNTHKWHFNPEYYIMRHLSQFVKPGAKYLKLDTNYDSMGFLNPDGTVVLVICNESRVDAEFFIKYKGKVYLYMLKPKGFTTLVLPA